MSSLKKSIIQIHKFTGLLMSSLFLMWCITGFVLLFVGFPHASRQSRFMKLQKFTENDFLNIQMLSNTDKNSFELVLHNNKAIYRIKRGKRGLAIINAKTLKLIKEFSLKECKQIALNFIDSDIIRIDSLNDLDSWVPWSYYKPLLPFYKLYFNDIDHTVLYVSSKSGDIIQQTTRKSRWLARLGAIPHKIYFKQIKSNAQLWKNVIVVLGILGLIVSVSGIFMGFIRLKSNGKGEARSITIYKKAMYKYHHLFGLFFGLLLCSYMLSGVLYSTGVPSWISKKKDGPSVQKLWNTKEYIATIHPNNIYKQLSVKEGVRKIVWSQNMKVPVVKVFYDNYLKPKVFKVDSLQTIKPFTCNDSSIIKLAKTLFPKSYPTISTINHYNFYYEDRGMYYHPLPVYKLELNNKFKDILYIDPKTGIAVEYFNKNKKVRRVLTKTLHKLEFPILYKYNKLRIIVSFLFLIALTIVSYTSLVLSIKYIKRTLIKNRHERK